MLHSYGGSLSLNPSLNPASHAAGTVNGAYVDISQAEGEVVIPIAIGAVTGSVVIKVQDADDTSGTNVADLSGVATASLNTANSTAKLSFPASSARKAVRVVATVTTGPVFASGAVGFVPKIV